MVKKIVPTKPVRVVPNGVDLEQFSPTQDNTGSEHSEPGELDMIYVGSVDEWLDLETVLDAMSNLMRTGFRTRLTVVGGSHGGDYLKRLSSQIMSSGLGEQVVFKGFVPHHLVPEYINRADVALVPFKKMLKNDVTSLKIAEYVACQKIVLSTRIPEISQRFGKFMNFYDGVSDLSRLLKEITVNRAEFTKRMEGARDFLSEYSWASLASKYYEILCSVAQR
jgi:glycosyltransferase involved in cell wall biosynthesis